MARLGVQVCISVEFEHEDGAIVHVDIEARAA